MMKWTPRDWKFKIILLILILFLLASALHRFEALQSPTPRKEGEEYRERRRPRFSTLTLCNLTIVNHIQAISELPPHVRVVKNERYDDERSLTIHGSTFSIASDAVILDIQQGMAFNQIVWCGIIDMQKNLYIFRHWENTPGDYSKSLPNKCIKGLYYPGTVMNLRMSFDSVPSHILGTILPKLNLTCNYLQHHPEVKILCNPRAVPHIQRVCGGLSDDRFFSLKDDLEVIQAKHMLWPFFWNPEAPFYHAAMIPRQLMKPIGKATLPRTILYMPRPVTTSRYLRNEVSILTAICDILSHRSGLQLAIFDHTNSTNDEKVMSSARVILSVHSGAMANMFFAPPDVQIIEIANPAQGNPFYIGMSRILGLPHTLILPQSFSHDNVSIPVKAEVSDVINAIQTLPEVAAHPRDHRDSQDHAHRQKCYDVISKRFMQSK